MTQLPLLTAQEATKLASENLDRILKQGKQDLIAMINNAIKFGHRCQNLLCRPSERGMDIIEFTAPYSEYKFIIKDSTIKELVDAGYIITRTETKGPYNDFLFTIEWSK